MKTFPVALHIVFQPIMSGVELGAGGAHGMHLTTVPAPTFAGPKGILIQ